MGNMRSKGINQVLTGARASRTFPAAERTSRLGDRGRLLLLSFLMLFTELALIRWTGSNVIYLSHFSNFVLLGSFLGIGVGFSPGSSPNRSLPLGTPSPCFLRFLRPCVSG
jgi:hypothetical protein